MEAEKFLAEAEDSGVQDGIESEKEAKKPEPNGEAEAPEVAAIEAARRG